MICSSSGVIVQSAAGPWGKVVWRKHRNLCDEDRMVLWITYSSMCFWDLLCAVFPARPCGKVGRRFSKVFPNPVLWLHPSLFYSCGPSTRLHPTSWPSVSSVGLYFFSFCLFLRLAVSGVTPDITLLVGSGYRMRFKPRLLVCKANILYTVFSLWPQDSIDVIFTDVSFGMPWGPTEKQLQI